MKIVLVAPVGDYMDELFVVVRDFQLERIVLIAPPERLNSAKKTKDSLAKFRIPVQIIEIKGSIWEEMFKAISEVKAAEKDRDIIVMTSTGDRTTSCASTSAAFVNGLKAIVVRNNEPVMLPVLKFSYYKLLTDKKMELLQLLYRKKDCCSSLEELSKKAKMSLPLISYHINGNLKSEGLKSLGLVETAEKKGKVDVKLSMLGRMLVRGYIK